MLRNFLAGKSRKGRSILMQRIKDYLPMLAGVSLIALGLCLPLGMSLDSMRLIDLFVMFIANGT